jgi:hypothetical protein
MLLTDGRAAEVTNGQQNKLLVGIENKSGQNITIRSIAGSLHHPQTGKLVKNVCDLMYFKLCDADASADNSAHVWRAAARGREGALTRARPWQRLTCGLESDLTPLQVLLRVSPASCSLAPLLTFSQVQGYPSRCRALVRIY